MNRKREEGRTEEGKTGKISIQDKKLRSVLDSKKEGYDRGNDWRRKRR